MVKHKKEHDCSFFYCGKKSFKNLFPFDTLNFLLLPDVNALDPLSSKNNAYMYYAIDYPKDFSKYVFHHYEAAELKKKFFNA